jgi:hypothetical protein
MSSLSSSEIDGLLHSFRSSFRSKTRSCFQTRSGPVSENFILRVISLVFFRTAHHASSAKPISLLTFFDLDEKKKPQQLSSSLDEKEGSGRARRHSFSNSSNKDKHETKDELATPLRSVDVPLRDASIFSPGEFAHHQLGLFALSKSAFSCSVSLISPLTVCFAIRSLLSQITEFTLSSFALPGRFSPLVFARR